MSCDAYLETDKLQNEMVVSNKVKVSLWELDEKGWVLQGS